MSLNANSIILIVFMLFVVGGICWIQWRMRRISRKLFGTDHLLDGIQQAKLDADAAPKSLSSLTRILLPKIEHDFPQFNWQEYREMARQNVRSLIRGTHGTEEIKLHATEISDYRNHEGTCYIRCQTSAGYRETEDDRGTAGRGGAAGRGSAIHPWIERKYETEFVYVQDVSQLPPTQTGVGLNCPNCGAPIKMLGQKTCPYCGTGITELNIRVWKLSGSKEL